MQRLSNYSTGRNLTLSATFLATCAGGKDPVLWARLFLTAPWVLRFAAKRRDPCVKRPSACSAAVGVDQYHPTSLEATALYNSPVEAY